MSAPSEQDAYILGTASIELQRLGLQNEIWSEVTEALWDVAGFSEGQQLLELGCGPGFSSLQLAKRTGSDGGVLGWDRSAQFLEHLRGRAAADGLDWVSTHHGDVNPSLNPSLQNRFDGVYARWLVCWMDRPQDAIRLAAKALRPGGKLVLHDYFHYHALDFWPRNPAFREGIDAVEKAWRATGGDPSIGVRLQDMVEQHGFHVTHAKICTRFATPKQQLWQWPASFFPAFLAQLKLDGFLSPAQVDAFLHAFDVSTEHPQGMFLAPPMLELVAEKL
ncbi:MAG: methyltransferase domain-containing protein [Planctomycetes bacterium]|nr:methyltransferase domain-containing protein [Planctomycetota bacterium]MCP4770868.1 methyltransferase domain-containing protein [Planctomycetota bacterium]MCP4862307.1 methyltransferase domain-containing protein [Planctomycetota bacterium]